jgi:succinylglutamate desuccinylase
MTSTRAAHDPGAPARERRGRHELYRRFDGYDDLRPLLEGSDEDALVALGGRPALIRIPGTDRHPAGRLVSCLLHGNEDSGFRAVLDLLREGAHQPFDLWVFIGNVRAASTEGWFAHRYLDDQEDFNRVWGTSELTTRMRRCAAAVLAELDGARLEGAVDLHNNTGSSPFYAISPSREPGSVHLAAVCADTLLLWNLRAHTLMQALTSRCPAIAVECGLPGLSSHEEHARTVIDRFLGARDLDRGESRPERIYDMSARVEVRPEVSFAVGGVLSDELDLVVRPGLDGHNFGMLLAGSELGQIQPGAGMPLAACDMHGNDVTARYFEVGDDGWLRCTEDLVPVMMTGTVRQIRRDCLFYVSRPR